MKVKKTIPRKKISKWIARGLLAVGAFALTLSVPFSFNQQAQNDSTQSKKKESSYVVHAESQPANKGVWTLYARLVMGDKNVKEDAEKTGQMSLIGSGGVSADFPYSDIAKQGNDLAGDYAGTELASTLATYNYYGYLETVSGNAIASGASSLLSGAGRAVGSFIGSITILISGIAEKINDILAKFFMSLNIFALMGWGENKTDVSNPISKTLTDLLTNLGLNNEIFKAVASMSLLFFCGVFGWQAMKALSDEGLGSKTFSPALKRWVVRVLVLFVFFPTAGSLIGGFISGIQQAKKDGDLPTNVVPNYIINTRLWASTQNLAPAGEDVGDVPSGNSKSEIKYVDPDYEPSKKSAMIAQINQASYSHMNSSLEPSAMSMALLKEWSSNDTFNVNTYAGDVNVTKSDIYMNKAPAVDPAANPKLKGSPTNLNHYIWTANQNVTDENRKPDGSGTGKDKNDFDASQPWGVRNNSSFSTQSVTLMLQSELNTSGTKLYAYNIAPTGVQGGAKNMSTVKTEWRTAALVGHGVMGKFGSWLAMNAESIVLGILYLACAWALFTINIVKAFKRQFLRIWQTALKGSPIAGAGAIAISLGVITTAVVALQLPIFLITFVRGIGDTAVGLIPNSMVGDGVNNIVRAIFILGAGYLMIFQKGAQTSAVVNTIVGLPLEVAFAFDDRAKMMLGTRSGAERMFDGMSRAVKNRSGAKNPYYDGSMKDAVTNGLNQVGAHGVAGRLEKIPDGNAEIEQVAKKFVPQNNASSAGMKDTGNYSFKELAQAERMRQNAGRFTDRLGRLVDEKGNFVDENGKPLKEQFGQDARGNRVDDKGRLIDDKGNLVDKDGNPIKDQSKGVSPEGKFIDDKGRLVDEDGILIDENGRKLLNSDNGRDAKGHIIDDKGRLIDQDGNLVDEFGNKVGKHGNGFNVNGDMVDDDGNIINSREALMRDRNEQLEKEKNTAVGDSEESLMPDRNLIRGKSSDQEEAVSGNDNADSEENPNESDGEQVKASEGDKNHKEPMISNEDSEIDEISKEEHKALRSENGQSNGKTTVPEVSANPMNKDVEKSKMPNQHSDTSNSAMAYLVKTGKQTYKKVDKALEQAPAGSLAGMTYKAKNGAVKVSKATVNGTKATTKAVKGTATKMMANNQFASDSESEKRKNLRKEKLSEQDPLEEQQNEVSQKPTKKLAKSEVVHPDNQQKQSSEQEKLKTVGKEEVQQPKKTKKSKEEQKKDQKKIVEKYLNKFSEKNNEDKDS